MSKRAPEKIWIARAYDTGYTPFVFKTKPKLERRPNGLFLFFYHWPEDKFIRIRWLRQYKVRKP